MKDQHFQTKQNTWRRGLVLTSLSLGMAGLLISAKTQIISISLIVPEEESYIFRGLSGAHLLLIVITIEGLKISTIAFEHFHHVCQIYTGEKIRRLNSVFKCSLFGFSTWCTFSLFAFYLTDYSLDKSRREHKSEWRKWKENRHTFLDAIYLPRIQAYEALLMKESMRYGKNRNSLSVHSWDYPQGYEDTKAEYRQAVQETDAKFKHAISYLDNYFTADDAYQNPLIKVSQNALAVLGISLSYQQSAYTLSLLLAILIELMIYVSFSVGASLILSKP